MRPKQRRLVNLLIRHKVLHTLTNSINRVQQVVTNRLPPCILPQPFKITNIIPEILTTYRTKGKCEGRSCEGIVVTTLSIVPTVHLIICCGTKVQSSSSVERVYIILSTSLSSISLVRNPTHPSLVRK